MYRAVDLSSRIRGYRLLPSEGKGKGKTTKVEKIVNENRGQKMESGKWKVESLRVTYKRNGGYEGKMGENKKLWLTNKY
jgi:hypothetical protein